MVGFDGTLTAVTAAQKPNTRLVVLIVFTYRQVVVDLERTIMANATKTPTPKTPKPAVKLTERIKTQLNASALKGKVTLDELSDLEQHIKRLASFMGV